MHKSVYFSMSAARGQGTPSSSTSERLIKSPAQLVGDLGRSELDIYAQSSPLPLSGVVSCKLSLCYASYYSFIELHSPGATRVVETGYGDDLKQIV